MSAPNWGRVKWHGYKVFFTVGWAGHCWPGHLERWVAAFRFRGGRSIHPFGRIAAGWGGIMMLAIVTGYDFGPKRKKHG